MKIEVAKGTAIATITVSPKGAFSVEGDAALKAVLGESVGRKHVLFNPTMGVYHGPNKASEWEVMDWVDTLARGGSPEIDDYDVIESPTSKLPEYDPVPSDSDLGSDMRMTAVASEVPKESDLLGLTEQELKIYKNHLQSLRNGAGSKGTVQKARRFGDLVKDSISVRLGHNGKMTDGVDDE